jgi:transcriptional regulator with GAF, ATPase, and Fis domain
LEARLVERALTQTEGNQTQAAKLLGVSRFGLQKMMRRLGIEWTPQTPTTGAGSMDFPRRPS